MELKEFVKSAVNALIEATQELQKESAETGAFINPRSHKGPPGSDFIRDEDGSLIRVTVLSFDVAVTEAVSKGGKAGGKLNVAVFRAEGGGEALSSLENVSPLKFDLRVALPSESALKPPSNTVMVNS